MNDINPVIMNINASLFQREQKVKELTQKVARLESQLVAEQRAYEQLASVLLDFVAKLRKYADTLSGAHTTPNANGIQ